ncbi:radical SAM protein [Aliarcobacter cryaerophilus]|uniref:radical SAM protein n=2 Tax=Aliarcobacter cryaerophilus TaxID=28198 RepID=UPI0011DF4BBA|nr:radical SAM protein [Aliarcobacter cryaerophilus]
MKNNIPDMLYVETTNICNANCIFCAYQYDKRPKTTMPFELLSKTVNEYKLAGGKKINFSPFAGEIFVDKDILKKINYVHKVGFDLITTYTNALLFHKFKIEDILNSGLTRINISLAPPIKDSYIKIYRNKNYKQLMVNIETLLKTFHTQKEKTIKEISIEFRSNISMQEIEELKDYQTYIKPYLNDSIKVVCMKIFDSWMGMINQNDLLDGMSIKNHNFPKNTPCMRLNMLQIMANGDARVCGCRYNNNDYTTEDIFYVGNTYNENIIDIYNKKKVLDLKQSFIISTPPLECQLCSWYEEIKL